MNTSHFARFHSAGASPANYLSKPAINALDRSISISATDCPGTFCEFLFAEEEKRTSSKVGDGGEVGGHLWEQRDGDSLW